MNLNFKNAQEFILKLDQNPKIKNYHTGICASYLWLNKLNKNCKNINLYAQNASAFLNGAYTSQISFEMLKDIKINNCLLGHSEARKYLNEDDAILNQKLKLAFTQNFNVIYCIGENLNQYQKNQSEEVLYNQILNGFKNIANLDNKNLIIAYEPIWAIGTGKSASEAYANKMCYLIKKIVLKHFKINITTLYGGSVNQNNITKLLKQENIDGVLVGGASTKLDSFLKLFI